MSKHRAHNAAALRAAAADPRPWSVLMDELWSHESGDEAEISQDSIGYVVVILREDEGPSLFRGPSPSEAIRAALDSLKGSP